MKSIWTKGLKGKALKLEKESLLSSKQSFQKLEVMLEDLYKASLKEMRKQDNYDIANWRELMIDHMVTQRTLRKVIDLLPLD